MATAINNTGKIVGTSDNRAFIWENGAMHDLNTMIASKSSWRLVSATGINESGQIVGVGSLGGDPFRAFLLTPITGCDPDLNSDGLLDFFDISALITAFSNQDPIADWNDDGAFNFFDISAYITAFTAGCP